MFSMSQGEARPELELQWRGNISRGGKQQGRPSCRDRCEGRRQEVARAREAQVGMGAGTMGAQALSCIGMGGVGNSGGQAPGRKAA